MKVLFYLLLLSFCAAQSSSLHAAESPREVMPKDVTLKNATASLRLATSPQGDIGLSLQMRGAIWEQRAPLEAEIVDASGATQRLSGAYGEVQMQAQTVNCQGELRSPNGTRFLFADEYTRDGAGFKLSRRVTILSPHAQDVGFSTRFALSWSQPMKLRDCDILMPGAWYRDGGNVPRGWFGSDGNWEVLMLREDRLGWPLTMARDKTSGVSLTLERSGGNPTTFAGEDGGQRLIDERLQTGAIGLQNTGNLQIAFTFPGSEDQREKLGGERGPRWEPRSHPVRVGVQHAYQLRFEAGQSANFAGAVETITKAVIGRARVPILRADLAAVRRASFDLLDSAIQPHNGTVTVPFQLRVPDGSVKDTSMQMGFVGQALPCAALLLQHGFEFKNASAIERATAVLDFWAQRSMEPSGVPKNWADFPEPNRVTFRGFPTHLRIGCDGMKGALQGWNVARRFKTDKPAWLAYARRWGDFLLEKQNPDGSWFGAWNFDGTPRDRFTNATTHALAFLVDLSSATGERKYLQAAMRAGEFCLKTVHDNYAYVGGTPDNPNVTDKEAGVMALQGFLALFDATNERKYLQAARQAAIFCETWVIWRDLPMPENQTNQVFPAGRSTIGLSLISTGHSGVDNFMAIAPFDWYRLYLATGDAHFLNTARLLLHNTKQVMDWDGKLGYKYRGLMPEAMTLAMRRGTGVAGWLPWLTFVALDPLVKLQSTFGHMEIDKIEAMPKSQRLRQSAAFAKTRGFVAP